MPKLADWSLRRLVDDIGPEGLRLLLREEGVSFQAVKTHKASTDPDNEAKEDRGVHPYASADEKAEPVPGELTVIIFAWTSSDR